MAGGPDGAGRSLRCTFPEKVLTATTLGPRPPGARLAAPGGRRVVPGPRGVFHGGVHVIVVGCGRVGSELAVALVKRGHSAVIIDKDPRAFRRLPPEPKVPTVVGPGFDRQCLEQ